MSGEPLKLTLAYWYNSGRSKILAHSGSYAQFLYGTHQPAPTAYPAKDRPPTEGTGQPQVAVICSPQSGVIVIDVDDPEKFKTSATAVVVSPRDAWCTRGDRFHIAVDARHVAREDWPVQGATAWGDIKANGFVPLPGSMHYSGVPYHSTLRPAIYAGPELIAAIKKDLADYTRPSSPGHSGGGGHDDELSAMCLRLYLEGKNEEEIKAEWDIAAAPRDPSWLYDDSDFARHMSNVPAKAAPIIKAHEDEIRWYTEHFPGFDLQERIAEMRSGKYRNDPVAFLNDDSDEVTTAPNTYSLYEEKLGLTGPGSFDPPCGMSLHDNAQWVLQYWNSQLRYDSATGKWWRNIGERWEASGEDLSEWAVLRLLPHLPYGNPDADAEEIGIAAAQREQNRAKRRVLFDKNVSQVAKHMKIIARAEHPSHIDSSDMDSEPHIMWAGSVPWNLRNSAEQPEVARSVRADTAHAMSAKYRPEGYLATPLWDRLTKAIWPDEELRSWALRVLSVTFTGESSALTPVLIGGPARGKTAVITLLLDILGNYGCRASAQLLDHKVTGTPDFHEYELKGCRLAFIDEAPRPSAQSRLKDLTGGGVRRGRPPYGKNVVYFKSTHTLVMTANRGEDDPVLSDEAVKRRLRVISCEGDPDEVSAIMKEIGYYPFTEAWRREAPGVLAKMMSEAAQYFSDPDSASVEQAPLLSQLLTADIIKDQDTVQQWYESETEPDEHGTRATDLLKYYTTWCRERNMWAEPTRKFTRRLSELAGKPEHRRDGNFYKLRIRFGSGGGFFGAPPKPTAEVQVPAPESTAEVQVSAKENSSEVAIPSSAEIIANSPQQAEKPSALDNPVIDIGLGAAITGVTEDPPVKPKRPRKPKQTPEEKEAIKAEKARLREEEKARVFAEKVAEAEGPNHELPVIVLRDGSVLSCTVEQAVKMVEPYLPALKVDVENSGYPVGHKDFRLTLVQLGGTEVSAVFDPHDPQSCAAITDLLNRAEKLHAHSAVADLVPLAWTGFVDRDMLWAKMEDSVLIAKLNDPASSTSDANGLKDLARDLLGPAAVSPQADKARGHLFSTMKCITETKWTTPVERSGWARVNTESEVFQRYSGSDVLDLGAVLDKLPRPDENVLQRERQFQGICARIAQDGYKLDHDHIRAKITEYTETQEAARQRVAQFTGNRITNPSSKSEVPGTLIDFGVSLPLTDEGNPSAAKPELELWLSENRGHELEPLLKDIIEYRHCTTTLGLLLNPLDVLCTHGDGRMRPTVLTLNADTGRTSCVRPNGQQFCYDSSTDILTDQGWKAFPEVSISDRVAQWRDGLIEFVYPEVVLHEAYNGPMLKISGEHHEQVVTPNHRVYSLTRRGQLMIESADSWRVHGAQDKIVDRKLIRGGRLVGRKLTNQEKLALYRAVAVQADGHLLPYKTGRVRLQWTKERKIKRARELGFEVRAQPWQAGGKCVYESWCKQVEFKQWLNLPEKTFNIPALLELDATDLADFLHEVMAWDGDSTRNAAYNQAMERSEAVDAVELAALLSGNSTCRSVKRVAGKDYACAQVFLKSERWASRTNVEEVPSDGMIHCVTVPSGAVVTRHGGKVVVSGNSRQGGIRACVTADDGWWGISADFQGCEIRVAGALSQDSDMLNAETSPLCYACERNPCTCGKRHTGLHWMAAHAAFDDPAHGQVATKEHRYWCKRGIFCRLFGGAAKTAARQAMAPHAAMLQVYDVFKSIAPTYTMWDQDMRAYVDRGGRAFPAYSGRTIWLPKGRAHAAGNFAIQGSARELLVDGVLKWDKTRWGKNALLPIHDEVFTFIKGSHDEALEAQNTLIKCMATELYGVPIGADADEPFKSWPDSS